MKIVILGAKGQLGKELLVHFKKEKNLKAFSKETLDIRDFSAVETMIKFERPDILVNAAAYTAVDKAEINQEEAYKINSEAVSCIAKNLQSLGSYLIHYSSDYVFDGSKKTSYSETDLTSPLNIYGKSKLAGEMEIKKQMENFVILRTSWVVGNNGNNFIKTILNLIKEKESLKVIDDQYGVPTSTELLSSVTGKIISAIKKRNNFESGIYNVVPKGKTTWYLLAKKILSKVLREKIFTSSKKVNIIPIKTKDYNSLAIRPKNSLLCTKKIENMLNIHLPNWEDDFNKVLNNNFSGYRHE